MIPVQQDLLVVRLDLDRARRLGRRLQPGQLDRSLHGPARAGCLLRTVLDRDLRSRSGDQVSHAHLGSPWAGQRALMRGWSRTAHASTRPNAAIRRAKARRPSVSSFLLFPRALRSTPPRFAARAGCRHRAPGSCRRATERPLQRRARLVGRCPPHAIVDRGHLNRPGVPRRQDLQAPHLAFRVEQRRERAEPRRGRSVAQPRRGVFAIDPHAVVFAGSRQREAQAVSPKVARPMEQRFGSLWVRR